MSTWEDIARAAATIKTLPIRGKEYAQVPERVKAFRMIHPDGSIVTEILHMEGDMIVMRATVSDADGKVLGTGTAFEDRNSSYINKTSYIENCETSCVGRALGNCGYGIDVAVSSAEEVQNAIDQQEKAEAKASNPAPAPATVTVQNPVLEEFRRFCKENGLKRDALEKYRGIAVANGIIPMKKDWGDYSMDEIKRFETFIVKNREMPTT